MNLGGPSRRVCLMGVLTSRSPFPFQPPELPFNTLVRPFPGYRFGYLHPHGNIPYAAPTRPRHSRGPPAVWSHRLPAVVGSPRFHTATSQTVCKLVTLRTSADTCISFPVNVSSTLRLRRGPTERQISHLFSCSSSLFPSRRTGIPPPSILFPALLPGVRSASARIAHFCAITPLLVTLAHFMGGGGV